MAVNAGNVGRWEQSTRNEVLLWCALAVVVGAPGSPTWHCTSSVDNESTVYMSFPDTGRVARNSNGRGAEGEVRMPKGGRRKDPWTSGRAVLWRGAASSW